MNFYEAIVQSSSAAFDLWFYLTECNVESKIYDIEGQEQHPENGLAGIVGTNPYFVTKKEEELNDDED